MHRLGLLCLAVCLASGAAAQSGRTFDAGPYAATLWTLNEGLPQNTVYDLTQARDGALWLATDNGPVRFDGIEFREFYDLPPYLTLATAVHEDASGAIWVGTYGEGAYRYTPPSPEAPKGRFERGGGDLPGLQVASFADGGDGDLWAASSDGVTRIARGEAEAFTASDGIPDGTVHALLVDRAGTLWVGARGGLAYRDGDRFVPVDLGADVEIRALAEAPDGTLWAGTSGGIVHVAGARQRRVTAGLAPGAVTALHVARDGAVWVGTDAPFVHRLDPASGEIVTLPTGQPGRGGGTRSILEDREGNVWVGTYGYGLVRFRRKVISFLTEADGLTDNFVRPILAASGGDVWIGTRGAAVHRLREGRLTAYRLAGSEASVMSLTETADGTILAGLAGVGVVRVSAGGLTVDVPGRVDPLALLEDRQGRLWIGLRGGLWRRDPDGRVREFYSEEGFPDGDVYALHEDARGQIWVGMSSGLVRAEVQGNRTSFEPLPQAGLSGEAPAVFALLDDPDDPEALWIASGAALARYSPEAGVLPLAAPRMLVHDGRGHLWTRDSHSLDRVALADLRALASGEIDHVSVTSYGREVGLDGEGVYGFGPPAAFTDRRLFFPTTQGVAVVDLEALGDALPPPTVAITHVEADTTVHRVLPSRLGPGLNRLVIRYAGIDLTAPERVRYRYRLEGFEADWRDADTRREAIYTNLPPGAYTFRVEALNHQGTWSEAPATFAFEVAPRLTQAGWFRGLLALALVGLGLGIYAVRARGLRRQEGLLREKVRQRTEQLQREKERAEAARDDAREARATVEAQAERLRELDAAKSRLFANLSHEFRTPLALILAPLEAAMDGAPDLQLAHDQATRLLDLVNQLLDLSTLDAGHLRLRREPTDLSALVTRTAAAFRSDADARGVALAVHTEPLDAEVDPAYIERIVTNLLANALAHTGRGGKVAVSLARRASGATPEATLTVRDTGEGIPPEALPHLFDRFFQVERASRSAQAGTGIGLALAQELAALHGGQITVESQEGFGSTFTVALPLAPEASGEQAEPAFLPQPGEAGNEQPRPSDAPNPGVALPPERAEPAEPLAPEAQDASRPTLLLVEDHADMRDFLARTLADAWTIVTAASGDEGLSLARQRRPDLVVSDVMMPGLDGFELTAAIRAGPVLRETPVLLLTARADAEGEITGLAAGADDYLAKPFSVPVLRARLEALLARRREGSDGHRVVMGAREVAVTSDEAAFVERVRDEAEAALGDPDLTVERLAERAATSPRQLTRRLKELTGLSPAAFVRSMRMQRAAQLLAGQSGTVSEVAYAVGFRSVSHFTKRFKAEFGVPPSVYAERAASGEGLASGA